MRITAINNYYQLNRSIRKPQNINTNISDDNVNFKGKNGALFGGALTIFAIAASGGVLALPLVGIASALGAGGFTAGILGTAATAGIGAKIGSDYENHCKNNNNNDN